ncbi:Hyphally regulated cell wall protein 3, partial [Meyerozyma sp. JA9]
MQLHLRAVLSAALSVSSAFAITISQNTVTRGTIAAIAGSTEVSQGVYWSIINNAITNFLGSLQVDGQLFISSNSNLIGLTVELLGVLNSITNNGDISFDSSRTLLAPNYNLVGLRFTNNGNMWLAGDGSVGTPVMSITSASWQNNGLIVFSQRVLSSGFVTLGTAAGSITNDGTICLINEVYDQTTAISGSGCFDIGVDSNVWIQNSLLSVDTSQTFYLSSPSSSMRVEALSLSQTFKVAGFGNGNILGLSLPITSWNYNPITGILTLTDVLLSQKFNIGLGYVSSNFNVITTDFGGVLTTVINGGIRYNGPPPARSNQPTACSACLPLPTPPGIDDTSSSIVSSATSSVASSSAESSSAASSSVAASSSAA